MITTNRIHPLTAIAAIAVTVVSLLGIATIAGVLPESRGSDQPAAPLAAAAPVKAAAAPRAQHHAPAKRAAVQEAPSTCASCGTVQSIATVTEAAPEGSGVGAITGAVLGGVLGNQVGGGNGRKLATVAGAVGGGFAGNAIEKRVRTVSHYVVSVRMDNGRMRDFTYANESQWKRGDQIRVVDGMLRPLV
ncbi:MAG TPA: glycine zipper 2TM domain-containing protein [Burkholderiaceae bacterium]